jgi:GNAT superfamily N-acetyltransferase
MAVNKYESLPPWPPPAWHVGPAPGTLQLVHDLAPFTAAFLDLEFQASEAWGTFVYGSPAAARAAARYLFDQGQGEFLPPYGRLVLGEDGTPVGMLATLGWRELQFCRLKAALALHQSGMLAADPAIAARIRLAKPALITVSEGDLYLSRFAVREPGVGVALLGYVERQARARGARQVVLEASASAGHEPAMRLYADFGFTEVRRPQVVDPRSGRSLTLVHMAKRLEAA